jgi:flagellar biosynthesis/type III secretory pathway chaperone
MNAPAIAANQSPLEAALHDVQATLSQLLVAADEQYAALAANDRERLESVTRQQERLSARLARAEAQRMQLVDGAEDWTSNLPSETAIRVNAMKVAIGEAVVELKSRQAQTASLLKQQIDLASQTINFLRRLVTPTNATYNPRGMVAARQSVLVDGRA